MFYRGNMMQFAYELLKIYKVCKFNDFTPSEAYFLTYRNNLLLKRPNLEQYETHPTTKLSIYIGSNIAKFS